MPKEEKIGLVLYEGKKNHFIWFGNRKQNENNEKQNEEPLILNFDDQDFYFYWSDFKIQHSKNFEYLKKNYSEIADFQQKQVFDKFHQSYNQEDLMENILDIKLKTVYVLRISWVKYQQIRSLISESRNLDKELNFKNQSKLSKKNANNWNLKGRVLLNNISIFRNSGFFIEDDINKFLNNNLIVNNETSEKLSLDFKNQNLLEKVLSLENNYEQLNSEIINFIDNLEQRNKTLTEISDLEAEKELNPKTIKPKTKPENYILKLQKTFNSDWQSQLILNNKKKLDIANNTILFKKTKVLKLKEQLKSKSDQFSKTTNVSVNKDSEILKLQEQLNLKSDELLRANNVISSYEGEIIKLRSDLREYDQMLNSKNISDEIKTNIIDSKNAEILKLEEQLNLKSDELSKINLITVDKDTEILKLEEQLNLKSDELLSIKNLITAGASEILLLQTELNLKSDELSKINLITVDKDTEILKLEEQLKLKRAINESESSNSQSKKQKVTHDDNSSYIVDLSKDLNNDESPIDLSKDLNNDESPIDLSKTSNYELISNDESPIDLSKKSVNKVIDFPDHFDANESIDLHDLINNNSDTFFNFSDILINNPLMELEDNELEF